MNSVKCPQCGLVNWAHGEACKRCQTELYGLADVAASADASYAAHGYAAQSYGAQSGNAHSYYQPSDGQTYHQPYSSQQPASLRNGLAIASLVCGVVSCMFGISALVGIVLGIIALRKAKKEPHLYGGKGLAVAGIATSVLSIIFLVLVIGAIAVPNLLASRRAANEAATIRTLQNLIEAQTKCRATVKANSGYCSLPELAGGQFIAPELADGIHYSYNFNVIATASVYQLTAQPMQPDGISATGSRSFFVSSTDGLIRVNNSPNAFATIADPPLQRQLKPNERIITFRE